MKKNDVIILKDKTTLHFALGIVQRGVIDGERTVDVYTIDGVKASFPVTLTLAQLVQVLGCF